MKKIKFILLGILMSISMSLLSAEKVEVDYRLNVLENDGKDYLTLTVDGKTYEDSYDPEKGDSKLGTDKLLKKLRKDKNDIRVMPKGLRNVLAFAVNPPKEKEANMLQVTSKGKTVTLLCCTEGGNAVRMQTDDSGYIDLDSSFKRAQIAAENLDGSLTFIKSVLKDGSHDNKSLASVDWNKIDFDKDRASKKASKYYHGKLKTDYKDGILTISGVIVK
ncbi:MAG: hypothetical protein K6F15_06055 [Treponema sp.]|nr:hypothetical protein [Treponema sp.]